MRGRTRGRHGEGRGRYTTDAAGRGHKQGSEGRKYMTLKRMDNILIVVENLEAAKAFFVELGMELEGETTVEGPSVDRLIGLQNVRATLALMRTPDGHGRIELD